MPVHRAVSFLSLVSQFVLAGLLSMSVHAQTTVAGTTPGQFAVSQSGAATYRIPIQVPPGVAGMEPRLELVYNSQSGNGLMGMGWGLAGLSSINRCPRTMASDGVLGGVNLDANDRFCLDGQRLILTSGTPYGAAATEYRTEIESFSKITAIGGDNGSTAAYSGPNSFTVKTKTGLTLEFGNTTNARIEVPGKAAILTWALNRITDTVGNFLTLNYTEDTANGSYVPSSIDYSGNVAAGQTPGLSVQFGYETRTDTRPFYVGGVLIKSNQRLVNVKTYTGIDLIKDYRLAYLVETTPPTSTLARVTECQGTNCLAPKTFEHTTVTNTLAVSAVTSTGVVDGATTGTWMDANADGMSDFCRGVAAYGIQAYKVRCSLSIGSGFGGTFEFATPYFDWAGDSYPDQNGDGVPDVCGILTQSNGNEEPPTLYRYCTLSNGAGGTLGISWIGPHYTLGPAWADVNGDGRDDLCGVLRYSVRVGGRDGTFEMRYMPSCTFSTGSGWSGYVATTFPYLTGTDYAIKWLDVNADGMADYCRVSSNGVPQCTLSSGGAMGTTLTGAAVSASLTEGRDWVDVNGDGRIDFCRVLSSNKVECTLNTGTGFAGTITSDVIDLGVATSRVWADVNGDGRVDFCREQGTDKIACNLSTGDGFSPPLVSGTIILGAAPKKWVDVNGDGYLDYCRNIGGVLNCATSQFMDSRIDKVIDGIGSSAAYTAIANQSIAVVTPTSIYTKDATGPYPLVSKQIPAYVVASVTSSDGIGGTVVTTYTYGGLKAETGTGRGMLGFRWINAKNTTTNIENYTEYRQDWPYTGIPLKSETRLSGNGNAGVLQRTTQTSACKVPQTAAACAVAAGNRYFPHVTLRLEESWDLNGTAYPSMTTSTAYNLNTPDTELRGDPTQVVMSTNHNGVLTTRTTDNEYWTPDTTNWILGKLKKATVTSTQP